MKKKIIGIFHDPVLLKTKTQALEQAGFDVCTASNLEELNRHLQEGRCDLVVIGHTIPRSEKLRIGNFVKQHHSQCNLLELYTDSPELEMAAAHVRSGDTSEALVGAVHRLMPPESRCG